MGRAGPGVRVLGLGMKMEQSLSPSAHLQHPMDAEAPVVGNSWRTLASGEALGAGRNGEDSMAPGLWWISLGFPEDQG